MLAEFWLPVVEAGPRLDMSSFSDSFTEYFLSAQALLFLFFFYELSLDFFPLSVSFGLPVLCCEVVLRKVVHVFH